MSNLTGKHLPKTPKVWYNMSKANTIGPELVKAMERELNAGHLLELMKLRDGSIIVRRVKKSQIN